MQFGLRDNCRKNILRKKRKINLYLAFVDLERACDRVPCKNLWWAMRKLGIDNWITPILFRQCTVIQHVQAIYCEVRSKVCIKDCFSDSFSVDVPVQQCSVLSPLLYIMVLSQKFEPTTTLLRNEHSIIQPFNHSWDSHEYKANLLIIAESVEELIQKLSAWKVNLEKQSFKINKKKTKIMFSGINVDTLINSGVPSCGICH